MTSLTEGRTSLVAGYLQHIADQCAGDRSGKVADYIPELAAADPEQYGLSLCAHDGYIYSVGDTATEFTIQSMSKPLTYAMALGGVDTGSIIPMLQAAASSRPTVTMS